ncbi:signal peptidase I [Hyphomicrobium sp. ghe19]|uniref:signal peptidase I n=1 Tax=Hyphomicrobium sp. ghe19 TaxID=2682968 RepID=UPI001366994E|nr:Signal peptidase I [Hyphomicrobium sp. ghe19]
MSVGIKTSRSSWFETLVIVVEALAIAMFVRIFFYQPFNIPSGSMKETLLIGDYLFVSKLSYGYSKFSFPFSPNIFEGRIFGAEPKRGDVAVFKLPRDNSTDYIKRVIGLPGDEIQMKNGQLFINGAAIPKEPAGEFTTFEEGRERTIPVFEETLPNGVKYKVLDSDPNGPYDNTGVYKVPEGHFFMMGDNRDNSTDSRVRSAVGFVPYENFIGRAEIIFFSAKVDEPDAFRWYAPWTWPFDIRWDRFFTLVR